MRYALKNSSIEILVPTDKKVDQNHQERYAICIVCNTSVLSSPKLKCFKRNENKFFDYFNCCDSWGITIEDDFNEESTLEYKE